MEQPIFTFTEIAMLLFGLFMGGGVAWIARGSVRDDYSDDLETIAGGILRIDERTERIDLSL